MRPSFESTHIIPQKIPCDPFNYTWFIEIKDLCTKFPSTAPRIWKRFGRDGVLAVSCVILSQVPHFDNTVKTKEPKNGKSMKQGARGFAKLLN